MSHDWSKRGIINRVRGQMSDDPPGLPLYNIDALPTPSRDHVVALTREADGRLLLVVSSGSVWHEVMDSGSAGRTLSPA